MDTRELRRLADACRFLMAKADEMPPDAEWEDVAHGHECVTLAKLALADAILSSNAVDVVEAVRALGVARAAMDAANVENVPQWHEVEKARARADRAEAELEQMRRERDNASEAFHKADTQLTEANRQLAAVRADADCVWFWQGDGHDHPESLACPVVMTADTLRALLRERDEALREAAGVPSQVIAELRHRGLLTAGDESVARSIESGILALIGASESGEGS